MEQWFYKVMGQELGPVSSTQLNALAQAGEVSCDTWVRKGVDGDWVLADQVRGLLTPPAERPVVDQGFAPSSTPPKGPKQRAAAAPPVDSGEVRRGLMERLMPKLVFSAVVLLAVSVLLQGITCWTILRLANGSSAGGKRPQSGPLAGRGQAMPVEVVNTVPVDVQNSSLDVDVQNSKLDVRLYDHYILSGDPIPVEIVK